MNLSVFAAGAGGVRIVDRPLATSGGGAIIVRMLYAPINPADLLTIDGRYISAAPGDAAIGAEGVGIVETSVQTPHAPDVGDLVLPLTRGNWAEYRILAPGEMVVVPGGIDAVQAAMLRINPATAWHMLGRLGVTAGDRIVQNAARSSVAGWVRRFAADRGVGVIDVARAPVTDAAIADGAGLAARIPPAGRPITGALDCMAGDASGHLAECLSPGATMLVFGHLSGAPCVIPSTLLTARALTVAGFSLRDAEAAAGSATRDAAFAAIFAAARDPTTHASVHAIVPIRHVEGAIAEARKPGKGRVLIALGG